MMGVPTFYTRLLSDEGFNHDLVKHMRLFISGSAPLLAETHIEFENRTGKKILERYGMSWRKKLRDLSIRFLRRSWI